MIYRCRHCKQNLWRSSKKAWIKSFCERTGKYVRLVNTKRLKKKV